MADREPIASRDSGRAIETPSSGDSSRWIAPVRESTALIRQGPRDYSSDPYVAEPTGLPTWAVGPLGGSSAADPGTGVSATGQRYYPGDDPFSVMADLFLRAFGADNPQAGEQQYSVVPQEVGGGGGNSILMLLILAGAGFAIYWFYFRKKGGASLG